MNCVTVIDVNPSGHLAMAGKMGIEPHINQGNTPGSLTLRYFPICQQKLIRFVFPNVIQSAFDK